jgi:hypothetical protein
VKATAQHLRNVLLLLISLAAPAFGGDSSGFDPKPWIDDLQQIRNTYSEKYANLEWAVFEREIDLSDLFELTEARLREAPNDEAAKAAIDRLTRILGDGHVRVRWPQFRNSSAGPEATPGSGGRPDTCQLLGYNDARNGRTVGSHLPRYEPLSDGEAAEFPAGLVRSRGRSVGIIRIGMFGPEGSLHLCIEAVRSLSLAANAPCERECAERVESAVYAIMSRDLANGIRALEKRGARTRLIDITGNGGGSEWVEAAARTVSPLKLLSERRRFVRGAHWATNWESMAQDLRLAEG